jgi:hypothetical protein
LAAALLVALLAGEAAAQHPLPGAPLVSEDRHTVSVELARAGATLTVTRTLSNAGLLHAQVDLPVPIPCEALLDQVEIETPRGWERAELLEPDAGEARLSAALGVGRQDPQIQLAHDSDTALLVSRDGWGCDARVQLYPVPPGGSRSFRYRLFVPSHYGEGRYAIELPSLAGHGRDPELELRVVDPEIVAELDGSVLTDTSLPPTGGSAHTVILRPRDPGAGQVRVVDLDLAGLLAQHGTPDPAPDPAGEPVARLTEAEFEAPSQLAVVPEVRRVVIVLDASRSLPERHRQQLQDFAAVYLGDLAQQGARVEILTFHREIRRVYHAFVPADWGATDLPKLEIEAGNGSELGLALAQARALLDQAAVEHGGEGVDWIVALSDLDLRSDFDLASEHAAAAAAGIRLHVVEHGGTETFAPATTGAPWTALAMATGGMAWQLSGDAFAFASELIQPTRIWDLAVELEFADGSHHSEARERWFAAGERHAWVDPSADRSAALERIAFVGEVWGRRRAWLGAPDPSAARRRAGALASRGDTELPAPVLAALAFYAEVVSPFSSAWALAEFDGTAPVPFELGGWGFGATGGYSSSIGCGGSGHGTRQPRTNPLSFEALAQDIVDHCQPAGAGVWTLETTDLEIVAVASENGCLRARSWATDITLTASEGHKRLRIGYAQGRVTRVDAAAI